MADGQHSTPPVQYVVVQDFVHQHLNNIYSAAVLPIGSN